MTGGQVLQVILSLAVVGFALYLATKVARRRLGPAGEPAMKVISRQSVERGQNLLVVEVDGNRHLIALTNGGATTVDTWDAPEEPEVEQARYVQKTPSAKSWVPGLQIADDGGGFAKLLKQRIGGTQWAGLGTRAETPTADTPPAHSALQVGSMGFGKGFASKLAAVEKAAARQRPQTKPVERPSADQLATAGATQK